MRKRPLVASIAGGALTMTLATLVVRILGLIRWGTQAGQVGSVGVAEAYAAANLVPNVLFEVVAGGALAGALVPLLTAHIVAGAMRKFDATISAILTWTVCLLAALGVLLAVGAPWIVQLIPRVSDPDLYALTVLFLRVFSVQLPLYGVSIVLTGALQAKKLFAWPAMAPGLSSLVVIATYVLFGHMAGGTQGNVGVVPHAAVQVLAWGTTAGVAALSLPLLIPVRAAGISLRPRWRLSATDRRRLAKFAAAGLAGLLFQQCAVVVTMVVLNAAGIAGAYPTWQYAQAVIMVVYGVLIVPVATAAFPALSRSWAGKDRDEFALAGAAGLRMIAAIAVVGATTMVAAAEPVQAFFGFTRGGVAGMSQAVAWSGISLVPLALNFYLGRVLLAAHRTRASGIGTASGWAAAGCLVVVAGVVGGAEGASAGGAADVLTRVAMATAAGQVVGAIVLGGMVRRLLGSPMFAGSWRGILTVVAVTGTLAALARLCGPSAASLSITSGLMWSALYASVIGVAAAAVIALWCRDDVKVLLRSEPEGHDGP
ncbi:murein biosynthesis integral membrane protein MurJ [Rarobacter incanus]|uniref:Putative peptidoglycan lipid II flippase n=1 Tax=Rarobacter incanus TaxID=153494 RepID=A0A542SLP4_9MICO|nr:lipid II flippase MurJ [Rarobacter incanus]TQK75549.1 putative peptidoglycan lipid II flippase [Rarobacter incanus]